LIESTLELANEEQIMKHVAVILSGCGVFDGAEIYESVLTLLAIEENQASFECFAPDILQHHVINHLTGEEMSEKRNVLVESARVVRGDVKPVTQLNIHDFDALIFPGGFGAAKNLSNFAFKGQDCQVETNTLNTAQAFAKAQKPIGFVCIAPAMIPHIAGVDIQLTIGNDQETAQQINAMGGQHINCPVNDIVIDDTHKIVSTPAYMLAENISQAAEGIRKLVKKVIELS
jgi:enhancing lycopene biosynthesis protein 2